MRIERWKKECWIGRRDSINWPLRSPDLTPMDFFFGGIEKGNLESERDEGDNASEKSPGSSAESYLVFSLNRLSRKLVLKEQNIVSPPSDPPSPSDRVVIFSLIEFPHSLPRLIGRGSMSSPGTWDLLFMPQQPNLTLVQTLVMPHFDYYNVLLSDLSYELSVKLQRVQNMCVRYVCNIRRYDHISPSFASLCGFDLKNVELYTLCLYSSEFCTLQHQITFRIVSLIYTLTTT
ncbi:hypothetical protein ANN_17095 [Periplaneta americana]|uniref:Uncharacterized protein n=1 Tax=Periplaneta americana TaxID=6978 RepID=A0ABQ8SRY9_PERAM|nr:hypothetical protein ANN_17095 [Periplaneta americana]